MSDNVKRIQAILHQHNFNPGPIDGQAGIRTLSALDAALEYPASRRDIGLPWGNRVSPEFRKRLYTLCDRLGMVPAYLLSCIAWESGTTFRADIKNMAGSGATGLIQFMPSTARSLGTTVEHLATLSPEDQLEWVERYFHPWRGRLDSMADHYMAILWPASVGKSYGSELWNKHTRPTTYRQNAGLDVNKDGTITKAEAAKKVVDKMFDGFAYKNVYHPG